MQNPHGVPPCRSALPLVYILLVPIMKMDRSFLDGWMVYADEVHDLVILEPLG